MAKSYIDDLVEFLCNSEERDATADFALIGTNGRVYVHKFILCARSPILEKHVRMNPTANSFYLNYSVKVLQALVEFLYCDNLPSEHVLEDVEIELLAIGNQYKIPKMVELCERSIRNHSFI
ncbi:hypothetical protein HDE_10101 [Halotydeus destructor]|nr:hypothetical protein HDE_10101 [Halotydeus destructor]